METGNRASLAIYFVVFLCLIVFLPVVSFGEDYTSDEYLNSPLKKSAEKSEKSTSQQIQQKIDSESGGFYEDGFFWFLLKLAGGLALASTCIWGIAKVVRKSGLAGTNNDFMQIHTSLPLSRSQYLRIVQVGQKFLVIGVTEETINKICEITDPEVIQELQLASEEENSAEQSRDFSGILNRFLGGASHSFQEEDSNTSFENLQDKIQDLQQEPGE